MNNQIIKGFGQGLGQLGQETVEKMGEEGQKIFESTITGKELLGMNGETEMSNEEINKRKQEDEIHKQQEINKIKAEMGSGRNVAGEMEEIRRQEEQEEDQKEKVELQNKERQEEMERQQNMMNNQMEAVSTNPAKQKKSRGSAFGHKKKSQPDQSQMSQTSEFKGKID